LGQFCDVAKVLTIHRKILAKFGYKLNMKVKFFKHSSLFFCHLLEPCIETWKIFLNFGWDLAIEKLKKTLDFSTFNY